MWKIGLPKSKEIVGEETVAYAWTNSAAISHDDYKAAYIGLDIDVYVPLLTQKSITRNGKTYVTNFSNYDAYANPRTISETGDKARNRTLTYWYNTSKNIVQNKPLSETVSGGFSGTFTTNFSYDANTGNLLQLNKYGVVTDYTYYTNGNLWTKRDANLNTTTCEWTNGRISKITNPIYFISRVINSNGTIASETNGRNYTTSFTYDGNLRLTLIDPPVGNSTSFTYPVNNS
jgi:YD repeat-containing protein